jgi:Cu2+-exporting ATPase
MTSQTHHHDRGEDGDQHRAHAAHDGAHARGPDHPSPDHHDHAGHDKHARHSVAMFRDRFWLTVILTIPTVIWSEMIQHWFGYTAPRFAGSAYIPAIFGTIVYFYGGWPFLEGGWRELRDRLPGMMTLISLAISVSFLYSLIDILGALRGVDMWW